MCCEHNNIQLIQKAKHRVKAPWQISNTCLRKIIYESHLRRVPGASTDKMDCPFALDKYGKPKLVIEGSSHWIHMMGPIGIYYIHRSDIHPAYKHAFSYLLWWLNKLRRRYVHLEQIEEQVDEGKIALAELEYLMPGHFCRLTLHLLQHICKTLYLTGPPHATWMFVYERWVKLAKGIQLCFYIHRYIIKIMNKYVFMHYFYNTEWV